MTDGPGPLFPFTRAMSLAMGAVLCFWFLVPLALKRGNATLAGIIIAVYVAYVVVNVLLWWRLRTPKR